MKKKTFMDTEQTKSIVYKKNKPIYSIIIERKKWCPWCPWKKTIRCEKIGNQNPAHPKWGWRIQI